MSTTTAPTVTRPQAGIVTANGIEIAYETFGVATDPTILLVMGLGTQMIAWPDDMCTTLADAGHHVVRFDNRDVGLSTHVDASPPTTLEMILRRNTPYHLADMAADAFGLLDALEIDKAHLVGASMGGFISQSMALRHPERVETLTLIMTSTGSRRVGRPSASILKRMATMPEPKNEAEAVEAAVETFKIIGSPDHFDEALIRDKASQSYHRSHDPGGRIRQMAAIMAQPDRTARLRKLSIPTLVVHGLADPLVPVSGGLALAKAIPGATFLGFNGMGHDLPSTLWPKMTEAILDLAGN